MIVNETLNSFARFLKIEKICPILYSDDVGLYLLYKRGRKNIFDAKKYWESG